MRSSCALWRKKKSKFLASSVSWNLIIFTRDRDESWLFGNLIKVPTRALVWIEAILWFWEKLNVMWKFWQFLLFVGSCFISWWIISTSTHCETFPVTPRELIKICFMGAERQKKVSSVSVIQICIIFILFHFPHLHDVFSFSLKWRTLSFWLAHKLHSTRCNCWWI